MAQLVGSDEIESLRIELSEIGRSLRSSFRHHTSSFQSINSALGSVKDDVDDECVLQWAEIERLPTFERLRSSLFDENDGDKVDAIGKRVVDVTKLGALERHIFIEKLIKHIENDNLRLLHKLRKRIDKVGVKLPTVEVRYKNLCVEAECEVVHGKPLPTLWNSFKSMIFDVAKLPGLKSKEAKISIINDVSGIIKPGRITLLLGPPGCGKTSLLKALSGNLNKSLKVTGDVSHNGYKLEEFVPQKTCAYISQNDLHIPEITVRETLDFSARCQGVGSRAEIMNEVNRREKEGGIFPDPDIDTYMKAISVEGQKTNLQTDYILKILGLDICADSLVGDPMRRGISGGQKKRLTTGEMIVGPTKALFMDEISNGLDSSTTYQIVACLQQLAHITDATILVSLLQPAPETFDLFDDIMLMGEGKIVYHGPRIHVLEFFMGCGFICPERKGVADFLQEVISRKDQAKYWHGTELNYSYLFIIASITMTVFLRTRMDITIVHANYYMGSLFYSLVILLVDGFPELSMTVARLAIFYKQRELNFYPAWAYAIPAVILKIPLSFLEALVWTSLTYYVIGYSPEAGRFFRHFILLFAVHFTSISMFRFLASICRTVVASTTAGSLSIIYALVFGGFIIPKPSMPVWLKWGFWLSPLTYGEIAPGSRAIISDEKLTQIQESEESTNRSHVEGKSKSSPQAITEPSTGRMVLPFEPLTVVFQDLQYYVDTPMEFVKEVLETVELDGIKDELVGMPGVSGLSTEQRKRLTIAVELVANPSIIFMDEPTTGLDARAAAIVMRAVKNVVDTGRTIVCTIHQPSIDIFEAFDELILLKNGGRVIYSGPLGQRSRRVIEYFEGISGVPKIRDNYNPATWMLEVSSTSAEAELGLDFAQIYKNSALHENNKEMVRRLGVPSPGSKDLYFPTRYSQSGWGQFKSCLWKQYLSYWRSPSYNLMRSMYMLFASLLFGLLFWDQGGKIKNEQSLFSIFGSMFAAVIFCGINNSSSVLPYVTTERNVLYREKFAGMYASWPFAVAQVIIEVPYLFAQSLAFVIITYPMIGYYWSAHKVFWYFYAMFCSLLHFTYLGMLLVSSTPSFPIAAILQSAFYTMFNLFSGFIIPRPQIPKWWLWLYYLTPTSWTLNAMLTSQYGDSDKEITAFGEMKTVSAFLKDYFGFHHDNLPIVAVVMVLYPIVFASLFAYCIGKLNFQRR
ncbi:hypothetical protein LguiB_006438 [Lonicera macranthoides]